MKTALGFVISCKIEVTAVQKMSFYGDCHDLVQFLVIISRDNSLAARPQVSTPATNNKTNAQNPQLF